MKTIKNLLIFGSLATLTACHKDPLTPDPIQKPTPVDAQIEVTGGTEHTAWYNGSDTIVFKCKNTSKTTVNGNVSDSMGMFTLSNLKDSANVVITAQGKDGGTSATTTVHIKVMSQDYTTLGQSSRVLAKRYDSASYTGYAWKNMTVDNCYPDYYVTFDRSFWAHSAKQKECPGSDTILNAQIVFTYTPTQKTLLWGLVPNDIRALTVDSVVFVKKTLVVNQQGLFEEGKMRLVYMKYTH